MLLARNYPDNHLVGYCQARLLADVDLFSGDLL